MKKLTTSVLAVVLTASFALVNAQKKDTIKTQDIEGVVVTALGIKREKKSLGYASQEVKADVLTEGTTNTGNIASQLSGKVAGLSVITNSNFAGSAAMVIRGIKGVTGSSPLVVIDGTPVNNDSTYGYGKDFGNALSDINQEDIASINVLKGAAASALYGERGLNGVILITTKNGKGADDGSWGVSWTSGVTAGFIDKSTFLKYQDKYGAGYDQDFYTEDPNPDGHYYANFAEDASWGPKFDPSLLVYQWDSLDPTSPNYGKATPWVAAKNGPIKFFETPFTYTNTVTLEKGAKGQNIMFSYDNMTSSGLMPNSKMSKNTFTLKANYDFTPKLHGSFYTTLNLQETTGRGTTGYSDNIVTNFRQWWQTNVDVLELRDSYFRNAANPTAANNYGNFTWNPYDSSNTRPIFWNNPYFQAYESYSTDQRNRSFSIANLTYDLTKNINILGKVSYDRTTLSIQNRLAVGSLAQTFGAAGNDNSSGFARQDISKTETNYDVIANYKFDLTDNINLSGIVGGTVRRNTYNSLAATTEGGLVLRNVYSLANGAAPALAPSETQYTTQTNSGYASASFDFYKLFYLDGTYRVDQSSTLPAGDNVYKYGSVTGALILSELVKTDWLKFWKVRANYAEVGGTADPYQLQYYYGAGGFFGNTGLSTSQTRQPNDKLKPQKAKEYEFGTEGSLFNNRVTFDVAYYKTKTTNQIISQLPISSASGLSSASINAGQIDNWGYEVQLGVMPVKNANFTWNIDANWSQNRNKVVTLLHNDVADVSNLLIDSYQGGVSLNAREGEAWGALVGSDYVYLNGERVINASTGYYLRQNNQIIGNVTPDWLAGIRNSMNYKGVSFSFLIDVRHGGDVFSTDMYYGLATGLPVESAAGDVREVGVVWPGVNPNGQVNTTNTANPTAFGSLDGYSRMPNSRFVYDGSYVKLREAAIGYTLPQSLLAGTFVRDAKISLVGRNLWIISKNLPYADPENMVGGGNRSYGWSIGSLPTTRDIGLNVTLKF
ncbi:SusC/RagA family TonB-linked outer membrane protein [Kaistella flava (ex Peng et al. 2021)]|uniref:SusC/RagA family TonB-linked outer membrane protein n=1 Tax=Kaistella flava (ex Peng et al. 2021) TaxID=2038776 RepID=A0A7M2YC25_9FLAO|nr:SusC/RagA family TonB-linked outer membrane protein [Kaistella flava (ex Peng et al. 2021)]QOW11389.1 SusC/RagA family TonB-linked outer membrane protein [Kaistella flava (ex Peng et al. 2021)]